MRRASALELWGLGVGAVVSGDFFGWQYGLSHGYGSLCCACAVVALAYWALGLSIAEMASLVPCGGGAASFGHRAMGSLGAFFAGVAQGVEYLITPAVVCTGAVNYAFDAFGIGSGRGEAWKPAAWLLMYVVFVGLNVAGVSLSLRFSLGITLCSLAALACMLIASVSASGVHMSQYSRPAFEGGAIGVVLALPFACWFFLAVEELPLAADEARDPVRDVPRAMAASVGTLTLSCFATLFVAGSVPPGASGLAVSQSPFYEILAGSFGRTTAVKWASLVSLLGLISSFHSTLYAAGRQVQSMARLGFFPSLLARSLGNNGPPWVALVATGVIGYGCCLGAFAMGGDRRSKASTILLSAAVFGAVLSYVFQMVSFLVIHSRAKEEGTPPPYSSPLGVPGAIFVLLLSLVIALTFFMSDPLNRYSCIALALWFVLCSISWALCRRRTPPARLTSRSPLLN